MKKNLFIMMFIFLLLSCNSINYKDLQLMGIVYDSENQALQFCEIYLDNKLLAKSDLNGHFKIFVDETFSKELIVKKKNYEIKKINLDEISSSKCLFIKLKSSEELLSEILKELDNRNYKNASELCENIFCDEEEKYKIDFINAYCKINVQEFDDVKNIIENLEMSKFKDNNLLRLQKFYKSKYKKFD